MVGEGRVRTKCQLAKPTIKREVKEWDKRTIWLVCLYRYICNQTHRYISIYRYVAACCRMSGRLYKPPSRKQPRWQVCAPLSITGYAGGVITMIPTLLVGHHLVTTSPGGPKKKNTWTQMYKHIHMRMHIEQTSGSNRSNRNLLLPCDVSVLMG